MKRTQRSWNSTLRRTPFRQKAKPREAKPSNWRTEMTAKPKSSPRPKRRGVDPKLRQLVIDRDGGCMLARMTANHVCRGRIDPHHVWRKGQGGPDADWNLVAVCRGAHDWIHFEDPTEAIRLGLLSRSSLGEFGSRQAAERRQRRAF